MRSWFSNRPRPGGSASLTPSEELQALEDALQAASHIMNDDMDTAEKELAKDDSSFHKLGRGLAKFLKSVLGFEKDVMAEAQEALNDAENTAYEAHRQILRHKGPSTTKIYTQGTEYLLAQAQVQIMSAVISVLTESVTESLKGFYKLRKAFLTLDAIAQEEKAYLEKLEAGGKSVRLDAADSETSEHTSAVASEETSVVEEASGQPKATDDDGDSFVDAPETKEQLEQIKTAEEQAQLAENLAKTDLNEKPAVLRRLSSQLQDGPDAAIFGDSHMDQFIHSSSSMCYGVLLLLISMLPPAFSTLTKIAGFKGDRKKGLQLLWQASKFGNINGAFAGLMLLGYYNGFIGFCDILPTSGASAFPKERCKALLKSFRERFPKSGLWLLEETRMHSNEKRIEEAVARLNAIPTSGLKQVNALVAFESSMNNMFLHRYELCADNFIKMIQLNNWSHGLYYYIAGCAHVERYRELLLEDPEKAKQSANTATDLLSKVTQHTGKKRIMARQLPFDVFVTRKLTKWQSRASEHSIPLVDAVGVSPIAEMVYFWNGYKRMPAAQLEVSLTKLDWTKSHGKIPWEKEPLEEKGVYAVLRAVVLRNLGRTADAREELKTGVLAHDKALFKGGEKDNWTPPVAHYEMGVTYWKDYGESEKEEDLVESAGWLEKSAAWEAYDLDARVGMRVKTGQETVKRTRETRFGTQN